jgi:transposase
MLQITPHHQLLLAVKPVDFRKGIDSLAALCRQSLGQDPFQGIFFIFTNRLRTSVKILVYDGQGFWLCSKRFSKGRLAWWPTQNVPSFSLNPAQFHILLSQGNPMDATIPPNWRQIGSATSSRLPSGKEDSPAKSSGNARAANRQAS